MTVTVNSRSSEKAAEQLGTVVSKEQHKQQLADIVEYLEKDAAQIAIVWWMVKTGKLKTGAQDSRCLPATSNKFNLVSMAVKDDIVKRLWAPVADGDKLANFKKEDKSLTHKILQFALDMDLGCAVMSKNIETLTKKCVERAVAKGHLLNCLICTLRIHCGLASCISPWRMEKAMICVVRQLQL